MTITLSNPVASNSATMDEFDVRQLKKALNRLGYYAPFEETGITGMADRALFAAIKAFQEDQNLIPSSVVRPDDDTIKTLNTALSNHNGQYIWRTVGDDKVRGSHASLNGQIRNFSDSPDPAEEFGCRCWAEVLPAEPFDPQRDAINPAISPLDFIAPGGIATKAGASLATRLLTSRLRDVSWIRNAPKSQIQHVFDRKAKIFGIFGNQNNKNLARFKKVLEDHIKSPDTRVIKGTYHQKPATHYYNPKTGLNIIRDKAGQLKSGWKLNTEQKFHMLRNGSLGGGK